MAFTPPFCPSRHCRTHQDGFVRPNPWFIRRGFRYTQVVGYVPKFQCTVCGKGFSQRTFDIDYWTHRTVDYKCIQNLLVGGSGIRQACRTLGVSCRLLANRHIRLAHQALALQARGLDDFRLTESLVFDGFESFTYSQYFPNNLNLLVSAGSQFVLGLNAAVLRRKGRMTQAQRKKRDEIEKTYRAPGNAIYKSSKEMLNFGCQLAFESRHLPITILSDEKQEYARALSRIRPFRDWRVPGLLVHSTTSSRAVRTLDNPLFPVNYLDRQLRKDLAEHVRETIRFAKRLEFSLERAAIHLTHHNYFKVFRSRLTGEDRKITHAQEAGLDPGMIERLREQMFRCRAFWWRVGLADWQYKLWRRETGIPIHSVTPLPWHLRAG